MKYRAFARPHCVLIEMHPAKTEMKPILMSDCVTKADSGASLVVLWEHRVSNTVCLIKKN